MTFRNTCITSTAGLMIAGCATTTSLEWLRDDHAEAIAADLAVAFSERWAPATDPIFVGEMPLRDVFETAIRQHGYSVTTAPDDAVLITGLAERIPPNTWHVGLTVENGIHINRLYRVAQEGVDALSSISIGERFLADDDVTPAPTVAWQLRRLPPPERVIDDVLTHSDAMTAPIPIATSDSACPSMDGAVFTFPVGSLKQGLSTALTRCGWSISGWPNDPTHKHLIVDWIVSEETSVYITSIDDLLSGLHAIYGLSATLNEDLQEIAFSMKHDI